MKLYWYWPFAREEELGLAKAVLGQDDELIVQTLDRPASPDARSGEDWRLVADLPDVASVTGGSVRWVTSRAGTYVGRMRSRQAMVSRNRPDLAHIMFLNQFTDSLALRLLSHSVPLVSTVHDAVPHNPRLPAWLQHQVLRDVYHHAGHLVVHHDHVRRRLVDEFAVDATSIDVIPLQVPHFGPLASVDPPREPTVLFFGTFRANKGIDVLLDAIELLGDRRDYRFHFAGQASPQESRRVMETAARDRRVTAEVGWVSRDRKSQLYSQSRLVVLPYTSFASQSGVLHDAYGHGRPVVASYVGGLGESVREDETGWVVPPGDAEALAAAIDVALTDDHGYAVSAGNTAKLARSRTPEVTAASLRTLYSRVLGQD